MPAKPSKKPTRPISYGNFTPAFIDDLARRLKGKRVLEVYAGNGYLASLLRSRGVDMVATTLFSGHDGHEQGMLSEVINMNVVEAVATLGGDFDILLVSWPTTSEELLKATRLWGAKPIVFIGEVYNHDLLHGGYAGCASDAFFLAVDTLENIESYEPRNRLEKACVFRLRDKP